MSEQSRVEDLLKTGVEEPVLPMSRLEAILRGEKITPQSRVEELLLQYNPSDILIEKRITANGTYFAVNDNADGYFKVVVDTPVVPPSVLDHLVETITENGTYTYTPEHDGFEDAEITVNVSGGNSLLYLGYGEQTAIDSNWAYGILPIDTINKSSNFDDYLEYDASTKYFTCKLGFDALIVFWVYNLHSSDNRPQVILNDSNNSTIESITTNSTSAGAKGGSGIIVRMSAGYRFKFVNPEEKGWGFVRAKFYKVVDTTVYDFNEP